MGKKYKMSSAQKRLFALYEIDKNSIAYNIPSLYKIEGEINIVKLNALDNYKTTKPVSPCG